MITYKQKRNKIAVYLDGKRVGTIHEIAGYYQYRPNGTSSRFWGDHYMTLDGCKKSLEIKDG